MTLAYVLSSCVGLTYILKYGSILRWLRTWLSGQSAFFKELFSCSLCLGFWSGALIGGALYFIEWVNFYYLLPLASAAVSWFLDSLIRVIQTLEMVLDKKLEDK